MSFITQYMLSQGVPQDTLILLLMLPVVAALITFFRQVIGIKGLDLGTPLIISFVFLTTGLVHGVMLFLIILLTSALMRLVVKQLRLLYLPRMALIISMVALAMLLLAAAEGYLYQSSGLAVMPVLAILIMITLTERFLISQIQRGTKKVVLITLETLFVATACFLVMNLFWVQEAILDYPLWVIAGSIVLNIFLGRWTGLRLSELVRFRDVIKHINLRGKQ